MQVASQRDIQRRHGEIALFPVFLVLQCPSKPSNPGAECGIVISWLQNADLPCPFGLSASARHAEAVSRLRFSATEASARAYELSVLGGCVVGAAGRFLSACLLGLKLF